MIGPKATVVVVVIALLYSLYSLKHCLSCASKPVRKTSVERYREEDERYESTVSAGFLSSSTLHTINIEGANGHVNCGAACSLGLRLNCSESGRTECPTILRTPVKSAVVFEDLTEGDYVVSVNCEDCEESETSCYAEPQEFTFPVQLRTPKSEVSLTEISLGNIKLYKKFTGQCSNEQVWRSRITCLGVLYTLMGAVLLLISLRVKCEDEVISSIFLQDMKWVLQSRCRS
ncbi:hypothetical protein M758_3G163600 [Ceratodon purpureus]|nr:hypothetical protein M758_3G163600 [Ceratodon purpureus]